MDKPTYTIEQCDSDLLGSTPEVEYSISFDEAPRHLLWVSMKFSGLGANTVSWPVWTPGSYKLREYSSHVGNLVVTSEKGTIIPHAWTAKNTIEFESDEMVTIKFVVFAHDRTVRTSHVNRAHAFIMPGTILPQVEGLQDKIHHVDLDFEDMDWQHCATQLSATTVDRQGKPGMYGALNYDILVDSPIEIGNHKLHTFVVNDIPHEVAIAGYGEFDTEWLNEKLQHIVTVESEFWGGLPYDRYVFILQLYPGMRGGLEHAKSSVNM